MTAKESIERLESLGARLLLEGEELFVDMPEGFPSPLIEEIRQAKAEIMEYLKNEIGWRVEAMKKQIPAKPPYPFFVAREGVETKKGECHSCGDSLTGDRLYLCQYCLRAKAIILSIAEDTPENKAKNVAQTA